MLVHAHGVTESAVTVVLGLEQGRERAPNTP
jgi:hypothetical protein